MDKIPGIPDVSLIVPFLNEEENLADLIIQLNEYADKQDFYIEAIFVDDGSTDNSVEVLRKTISKTVSAKLINLSKNYGSHAAIRAGIMHAEGKYTMIFSADLQEPVSMIGLMYEKSKEGNEIVIARKTNSKESLLARSFSNIYTALVRKYAVNSYPRGGANNFLFSKKIRDLLRVNIEANSSIHMQIMNMGFKRAIVDVTLNNRNKGKSKWSLSKKIKLFIDSFIAFSYAPIRAISLIGILMFASGFLYALFILITRLTGVIQFDIGFPTLICVLLLGFGLTNLALGVIAEYLWRTLDVARGRPVFIIDNVETLHEGTIK